MQHVHVPVILLLTALVQLKAHNHRTLTEQADSIFGLFNIY